MDAGKEEAVRLSRKRKRQVRARLDRFAPDYRPSKPMWAMLWDESHQDPKVLIQRWLLESGRRMMMEEARRVDFSTDAMLRRLSHQSTALHPGSFIINSVA